MAGAVEYDELTIKISAKTDEADKGIRKVASSLKTLDKRAKELDVTRLQEVQKLLQDIANINFTNVIQGLRDVAKAFRLLNNATGSNKGVGAVLGNVDFSSLSQETQDQIEGVVSKYVELADEELKQKEALKEETGALKEHNKALKEANKETKKFAGALNKLTKDFARILKYRILRKVLQEIYKAFTEGIKNVAEFDTGVQDSLSHLVSAFTYVKNSIGAMFAPLIQIVAPILEEVMMLVGELSNAFAEFFASMNGQDTFTKATYELEEYNKEAKKTQALGIDELNVLNPDQAKGGFTTEQVNLGEKENELAQSLREVFNDIKDIVGTIISAFKNLAENVMPALQKLLKPVLSIISMIADLIVRLVNETMDDVNGSIAQFVDMLAQIFGFIEGIVKDFMPSLVQAIHIIGSALNIINSVLSIIFAVQGKLHAILKPIAHIICVVILPVINVILAMVSTIFHFVEAIVKSILALLNADWGKLANIWKDFGNDVKKAWVDMGEGNGQLYGVEGFATGGFPEDGVFFANHTELVGQFANGQTAVANNDQIIEGIKQGVLEAMLQANTGGKEIIIQIDGKEVAKAVNRQNANSGYEGINGGYKYGY